LGLEAIHDVTMVRMMAFGVAEGWRCLEAGAGGGSIARWLCNEVGPDGVVEAIDLDPRFLEENPMPNLHVRRCDLTTEALPTSAFDTVHARACRSTCPIENRCLQTLCWR